jgi:hypothetical protein
MISVITLFLGSSMLLLYPIISEAQLKQKTFVTHSGFVVKTSG